jgi:hypothetical protein
MRVAGVTLLVSLVWAVGAAASPAGSALGPIELGQPDVVQVGWGSRSMVPTDLDGDGLLDLALIDNDHARLVLLHQRAAGEPPRKTGRSGGRGRWSPVLEDAAFDRLELTTGVRMYDLAVGDLNGDGRPDLAYTGTPVGLTVWYQGRDGRFVQDGVQELQLWDPVSWSGTVVVEDLDRDGRNDLAVLTDGGLAVLTQDAGGELKGPDLVQVGCESCYGLHAGDINDDQLIDVAYQEHQSRSAVRVRFGSEAGIGAEVAFGTGELRGDVAWWPRSEALPTVVGVEARSGLVTAFELTSEQSQRASGLLRQVLPRAFSAGTGGSVAPAWVLADLDGDQRLDVVVSDPRGAEVLVSRQPTAGVLAPAEAYPSLADVRHMAAGDVDGDGRSELLLASPAERVVAWTGIDGSGRLRYPQPIETSGRPRGVAAADLDRDGVVDIVAVLDEPEPVRVVLLRGTGTVSEWERTVIELADLAGEPDGVLVTDLDASGTPDLVIPVERSSMRILLQDETGAFEEVSASSDFRRGLVDDVARLQLARGDVGGRGGDELLIASERFVRAVQLSGDGVLEVVDQLNPRVGDTRLEAGAGVDLDADGTDEFVLVAGGGSRLEVLQRSRSGVYRSLEAFDVPDLDLVQLEIADLDGNGREDVVLLGQRRLVWLPVGLDDLQLERVSTFETELEDVQYSLMTAGDLDADGSPELVAIDSTTTHVLEVLSQSDDGWTSRLAFTVYDADPHYEGQTGTGSEPREAVIADLTGDGRDDLVVLVHDRVLLYPQL